MNPYEAPTPAAAEGAEGHAEYRVAHLHERLVDEGVADLGLRVEDRGGTVIISGSVATEGCRATVLRLADEVLTGLDRHVDVTVAELGAPDRAERLL
ncbi:hypothetical protein ACFO3J_06590 [Streptomyces polygonati]|uniref:BON domain-containing protein n=1 Tax=Streptomyces polygonati TaxID=1617087 RepID=A0ABV8HJ00_9ACTN